MFDMVTILISARRIPALDELQMSAGCAIARPTSRSTDMSTTFGNWTT